MGLPCRFCMTYRGHNGIKSFKKYLGETTDFRRVLIGIDRPDSRDPDIVGDWVLGKFS